eukprot:scaffold7240_cov129-Isochrysis_galbana.AAC.2
MDSKAKGQGTAQGGQLSPSTTHNRPFAQLHSPPPHPIVLLQLPYTPCSHASDHACCQLPHSRRPTVSRPSDRVAALGEAGALRAVTGIDRLVNCKTRSEQLPQLRWHRRHRALATGLAGRRAGTLEGRVDLGHRREVAPHLQLLGHAGEPRRHPLPGIAYKDGPRVLAVDKVVQGREVHAPRPARERLAGCRHDVDRRTVRGGLVEKPVEKQLPWDTALTGQLARPMLPEVEGRAQPLQRWAQHDQGA